MGRWSLIRVLSHLRPQEKLERSDVDRGLRMMLFDNVFSNTMVTLTSGAFLIGFALLLGASNTVIGLLSAIPPLSQVLQLPAIVLVEKTRLRKAVVVVSAFLSRASWMGIVAVPWVLPAEWRLPAFLFCLVAFYGIGAFAGCAYNSWVRDLVPEDIMGRFFARRMAWAIGFAAVASLVAGAAIDAFRTRLDGPAALALHGGPEMVGYSLVFSFGTALGLTAVFFLARMPEPRMHAPAETHLGQVLAEPFRDTNYRQLLIFLASWNFSVNFAAPFFAVYMLRVLELTMTWVLALSVLSQVCNVLFLRLWGRLADRFTNKSVLAVAGPLFILGFMLWPFTTMPERYVLSIPLLIVIHVLGGMSTAGILVSATNIALKAAPHGKATAYLAMNALVSGAAATLAPLIAGFAADWFETQRLTLTLHWESTAASARAIDVPALMLTGLDFLFVIAFLLGLHAMHRLLAVKEEGEVTEEIVVQEFYAEIRRSMRSFSQVFGLRILNNFPYASVKGPISDDVPAAAPETPRPADGD